MFDVLFYSPFAPLISLPLPLLSTLRVVPLLRGVVAACRGEGILKFTCWPLLGFTGFGVRGFSSGRPFGCESLAAVPS